MAYRRFGGEAVPVRYSVREPDASLAIVMTNEAFVPSFDILSSVPIRSIEADHVGIVIPRRPPLEYRVFWSHSRGRDSPTAVGGTVRIRIELESRAEPVLLSGVVRQSGFFFFSDI